MSDRILLGEMLALSSAFMQASGSIIISRLGKRVNSNLIGFARMVIVVPIMIASALIADGQAMFQQSIRGIVWILISGVIGFFITDIFLYRSYAVFGAHETTLVMCLIPVLSTIVSAFLFGEVPTGKQTAGIALTVVGIVVMALRDVDKNKKFFSYGFTCALLAVVFQTCSDLTAKVSITKLPYVSTASLRGMSGLAAWIVYSFFSRKKLFSDLSVLKQPKNLGLLTMSVILSTWLGTTLAMGAIKYAPVGIASCLKQFSPVIVLPYDYFILKKRSVYSVVGTAAAVAGVVLIFS